MHLPLPIPPVIKYLPIHHLTTPTRFLLSSPIRPQLYESLQNQLPHFPLIHINTANEIVFGIDYYHFLLESDQTHAHVLELPLSPLESLFLNYNLKEKFTGINPYEKLLFLKKILPLTTHEEIYHRTNLDIPLSPELKKNLDLLLTPEFQEVLTHSLITLKTALQLLAFPPPNRAPLLHLLAQVPFTASQQTKLLEIIEEILFRDKCTLPSLFEKLQLPSFLDEKKPAKFFMETLFRYRNPLFSQAETQWQEEIKKLKLPANTQITHTPFFEKQQVELSIRLPNPEELKKILARIHGA